MSTFPRSFRPLGLASPLLLALTALAGPASAQLEVGGRPLDPRRLRSVVPTLELAPVDVAGLRAEDALRGKDQALRFGETIEVDLGLDTRGPGGGVWEELSDGTRVWRIRLHSPGAYSLSLVFSRFQLPPEGELFVYDDERSVVRGAYTYLNHNPDGRFAIQPTPGDALTLEYREPAGLPVRGSIQVQSVIHDYVDVLGRLEAGTCNIDVACAPQLSDQVRSVVKTLAGPLLCSGVLLNNTGEDGTQLLLTAQHCGDLSNGVFVFQFQRPSCGSGTGTQSMTVQGAKLLASDVTKDFQLLRILPMIPSSYQPFLAGWNRTTGAPPYTFAIHHPTGDEKAVCVDLDPPVPFGGTRWRILTWDVGTTEVGSSGCPLFDPCGLVIGSLQGGFANCANPSDDRFVRMDVLWPDIAPYLDPEGLAPAGLGGYDPLAQPPLPLSITGSVPAGVPILQPGLGKEVQIKGTGFDAQTTIAVDGVPVPAGSYGWVNSQTLELDFPQMSSIGSYDVTLTKGAEVVSLPIQVVPVSSPKLQIGNGEKGNQIQISAQWLIAGQPGDLFFVTFSTSSIPSIHPAWMLQYGNQFTEVVFLGMYTIPGSGLVQVSSSTAGFSFVRVYATSSLLNGVYPALQSNLQEIFVLF